VRFAVDENFNNDVLRGVRRRAPDVDIVRIQHVGLSSSDDSTILAWCAAEGRVLFTHDVNTMTAFAYDRVRDGLAMPGVIEASPTVPVRDLIENIVLIAECSLEGEWEGQVRHLPLR
jgi:uncharacterized protein DUF5615